MPKVLVWKCPHTGKLFEQKRRYDAHLRRLSRIRCANRKWRQLEDDTVGLIKDIQQVNNMQEWCEFIFNNQKAFIIYGCLKKSFGDPEHIKEAMENGWNIKVPKIQGIDIYRCNYSDSTRNTHSCPRNGKTNWGGRAEHGIRGYPGWSGNIHMDYVDNREAIVEIVRPGRRKNFIMEPPSVSDMSGGFGVSSSVIGVNTGTGTGIGGGHFGIEIFLQDFPNMEKAVKEFFAAREKENMWRALSSNQQLTDLSVLHKMGEGKVGVVSKRSY